LNSSIKVALVLPSNGSGGLERVISELAGYFSTIPEVEVNLICFTRGTPFFNQPPDVKINMPSFSIEEIPRMIFISRLYFWLRKLLRYLHPDILLTFGGKYNSFVLMAAMGLPMRTFISDRSQPSISYGTFLDWLNPILYKKATGIIAQTDIARMTMEKRIGHKNIFVIGNPLNIKNIFNSKKENIILNIGRFIPSKQQELLVTYFAKTKNHNWSLIFLGDGPTLENVKARVISLGLTDKVFFHGTVINVFNFYARSSIFAFTSRSEGFPNVLGEAMAAGLACVSFDCEAGPANLIDNEKSGFLVKENDHEDFICKLGLLMDREDLREAFGQGAREKVKRFSTEQIGKEYMEFFRRSII